MPVLAFYLYLLTHLVRGGKHAHVDGCPFCEKGPDEQGAIAQTRLAYIKHAPNLPDRYLIVARFHWEQPWDYPVTYWFHVCWLLMVIKERIDNLSQNLSDEGGRKFPHGHIWVITERRGEEGLPTYHTGMAGIIEHIKKAAGGK